MRSKQYGVRWLLFALLAAGTLQATVCIGPDGGFFFTTGDWFWGCGDDDCWDDCWDDCDDWDDHWDDVEDWWDDFWDD